MGIEARGRGETDPPDRCRDIVISGNYLHADTGLLLRGECRGFVVQGNTFINNPAGAIVVDEGAAGGGHAITGNVVRKSVYDGVYVRTASPCQGGILLGDASDCVVSGNLLESISPGPAIAAAGGGHAISGNRLSRCTGEQLGTSIAGGSLVASNLE